MPSDANSVPPSYAYFAEMRDHLQDMKPDEQSDRAVLIGGAQKMIDTLKDLETAGISEVVLYFNVGLKPHQQVKDEMQRFMEEVAPSFNYNPVSSYAIYSPMKLVVCQKKTQCVTFYFPAKSCNRSIKI